MRLFFTFLVSLLFVLAATVYDLSGCACCGTEVVCCEGSRIPPTLNIFVEVEDGFPGPTPVIGSFNLTLTYGTYAFPGGTLTGWYGCYEDDTCLGITGIFVYCDTVGPGFVTHIRINQASCNASDFDGPVVTGNSFTCDPLYVARQLILGQGYGTGQGYCTFGGAGYIRVYGTITE